MPYALPIVANLTATEATGGANSAKMVKRDSKLVALIGPCTAAIDAGIEASSRLSHRPVFIAAAREGLRWGYICLHKAI
jgi:hypothetical protein